MSVKIQFKYSSDSNNFNISIFSKNLNYEIVYTYVPYIRKAIDNLCVLCRDLFGGLKNNKIYYINIVIKPLVDAGGVYQHSKQLICIHEPYLLYNDILEFESTVFHELIHYVIHTEFGEIVNSDLDILDEGIAFYFSNLYYSTHKIPMPNYFLSLIPNNKFIEHYAGYYIVNKLLKERNFNKIFNHCGLPPKIVGEYSCMIYENCRDINKKLKWLIKWDPDFILVDKGAHNISEGYSFIFRDGYAPFVNYLSYYDLAVAESYNVPIIAVSDYTHYGSDSFLSIIPESDSDKILDIYVKLVNSSRFENRIFKTMLNIL